jgi:ferredoxin
MTRFRIKLHRQGCISSGACVEEAPQLFIQDENGIVSLRAIEPPDSEYQAAVAAANACPAAVIELEEISE